MKRYPIRKSIEGNGRDAAVWVVMGPEVHQREVVEGILTFFHEHVYTLTMVPAYVETDTTWRDKRLALPSEAYSCYQEICWSDDESNCRHVIYISCRPDDLETYYFENHFIAQEGNEGNVVEELVHLLVRLHREDEGGILNEYEKEVDVQLLAFLVRPGD